MRDNCEEPVKQETNPLTYRRTADSTRPLELPGSSSLSQHLVDLGNGMVTQ